MKIFHVNGFHHVARAVAGKIAIAMMAEAKSKEVVFFIDSKSIAYFMVGDKVVTFNIKSRPGLLDDSGIQAELFQLLFHLAQKVICFLLLQALKLSVLSFTLVRFCNHRIQLRREFLIFSPKFTEH